MPRGEEGPLCLLGQFWHLPMAGWLSLLEPPSIDLGPLQMHMAVSLQWLATQGCPSGRHDAILLALDLEELGHAGEVLLVGLGHFLLRCLWVHNLQALGR